MFINNIWLRKDYFHFSYFLMCFHFDNLQDLLVVEHFYDSSISHCCGFILTQAIISDSEYYGSLIVLIGIF